MNKIMSLPKVMGGDFFDFIARKKRENEETSDIYK